MVGRCKIYVCTIYLLYLHHSTFSRRGYVFITFFKSERLAKWGENVAVVRQTYTRINKHGATLMKWKDGKKKVGKEERKRAGMLMSGSERSLRMITNECSCSQCWINHFYSRFIICPIDYEKIYYLLLTPYIWAIPHEADAIKRFPSTSIYFMHLALILVYYRNTWRLKTLDHYHHHHHHHHDYFLQLEFHHPLWTGRMKIIMLRWGQWTATLLSNELS